MPALSDRPRNQTGGGRPNETHTYDYLGRMQEIIYPDGEVLEYVSDHGGKVLSVAGTWRGAVLAYAKEIRYDEFGQRSYMRYGNDVETTYAYDPERRWLSSVVTTNPHGETLQNISYTFDFVGNVTSITNKGSEREVTQTSFSTRNTAETALWIPVRWSSGMSLIAIG
jgi:hypothetical protein